MKEFFNKIGAFFSSDWFKAVAVAIVVGLMINLLKAGSE